MHGNGNFWDPPVLWDFHGHGNDSEYAAGMAKLWMYRLSESETCIRTLWRLICYTALVIILVTHACQQLQASRAESLLTSLKLAARAKSQISCT